MGKTKHFFWLKFKEDYFNQKEIKKLRRIAGGDTFTIIYLKMQLLSIKNDGILKFDATEENLAEQLSLELDEDVDNIKVTLEYLNANNLIEKISSKDFLLNKVPELIGNETDSAERMRKLRANSKLQIEKSEHCSPIVQKSDTELEKELEKEIEIKKDIKTKKQSKAFWFTECQEEIEKLQDKERVAIFMDFLTYRKERKLSYQPISVRKLIEVWSSESNATLRQVVDKTIANGWQGLFLENNQPKKKTIREGHSVDMSTIKVYRG